VGLVSFYIQALHPGPASCDISIMTAARKLDPYRIPESDPLWQALQRAPLAAEPIPAEELEAAEAALDDILSGRVEAVPHSEVHAVLERRRLERDE